MVLLTVFPVGKLLSSSESWWMGKQQRSRNSVCWPCLRIGKMRQRKSHIFLDSQQNITLDLKRETLQQSILDQLFYPVLNIWHHGVERFLDMWLYKVEKEICWNFSVTIPILGRAASENNLWKFVLDIMATWYSLKIHLVPHFI